MHCAGDHDARVAAAAEEAGLQLRPRNVRVFDEVVDIVKFDLVIVLDHFDHTEVRQYCLLIVCYKAAHLPALRYVYILVQTRVQDVLGAVGGIKGQAGFQGLTGIQWNKIY